MQLYTAECSFTFYIFNISLSSPLSIIFISPNRFSLFLCQTHPKSKSQAHQIIHIQIHKESSKTHIAKKKKTEAEKEKDEVKKKKKKKKKKGIKDPLAGVAGGSCTIFWQRAVCGRGFGSKRLEKGTSFCLFLCSFFSLGHFHVIDRRSRREEEEKSAKKQ